MTEIIKTIAVFLNIIAFSGFVISFFLLVSGEGDLAFKVLTTAGAVLLVGITLHSSADQKVATQK